MGRLAASLERSRPKVDGLLITNLSNIRYLTGFTGSNAYVVFTGRKNRFLTDGRYAEQSESEVTGPFVRKIYNKQKGTAAAAKLVKSLGLKVLAFEGDNLSYNTFLALKRELSGVSLTHARHDLVGELRRSKDGFERPLVADSAALLDTGFNAAAKVIRPGVSELEVAADLEAGLKKRGAEGMAFETIVASGPRGALPHGKASAKKIRKGDLVVLDMGVILAGYNSDCTRTFCVGKAGGKQKEVYSTVLGAQAAAIGAVRAGATAADVDKAARDYIDRAGYGSYFGHATGHGVGLDIHEAPYVGPRSKDVLTEGMVITVEPGIYIPGWGGVRIEDMALVEKDGCRVLTDTTRELICL